MNKPSFLSFYWLFTITFYLLIIISIIMVGVEITRCVRNDYPVTYSLNRIKQNEIWQVDPQKFELTSADSSLRNAHVVTGEWRISFETVDRSVKIYMALFLFVQIGYILLIFITLRSFVLSLKKNEAFTIQNIKRLQRLGILLVLIEPLNWVGKYFFRSWMSEKLGIMFERVSFAYRLGYSLGAREFIWNWILAGLLVLIIAEVFKQGLKLKEEVDLTV